MNTLKDGDPPAEEKPQRAKDQQQNEPAAPEQPQQSQAPPTAEG